MDLGSLGCRRPRSLTSEADEEGRGDEDGYEDQLEQQGVSENGHGPLQRATTHQPVLFAPDLDLGPDNFSDFSFDHFGSPFVFPVSGVLNEANSGRCAHPQ